MLRQIGMGERARRLGWASALAVVALSGCGHLPELDDNGLRADGAEVGRSAAALMTSPVDEAQHETRVRLRTLGEALWALAAGHQRYLGGKLPPRALSGHGPTVADAFSWDGKDLTVDWTDTQTGFGAYYSADLRLRDRYDDASIEHDDPMIHRTLVVRCGVQPAGHSVRLEARFVDLRLDGDGCAAGGSVQLRYASTPPGAESVSGTVVAQFHGCGRIAIH